MAQLKTPGVYIKETSNLAPSIAEVPTAVPVFMGYTEKQPELEGGLPKPVRINNMMDYEKVFGKPYISEHRIVVKEQQVVSVNSDPSPYLLLPSLELFFNNGGGTCYIISAGTYEDGIEKDHFIRGLQALEKEDEPTLIMLTDAVNLNAADYHDLVQTALRQCAELKDRFCIIDVLNYQKDQQGLDTSQMLDTVTAVKDFRNNCGTEHLMYGSAYYPYLKTTISPDYSEDMVKVDGYHTPFGHFVTANDGLRVIYNGSDIDKPKFKVLQGDANVSSINFDVTLASDTSDAMLSITLPTGVSSVSVGDILSAWAALTDEQKGDFDLQASNGSESTGVQVEPLSKIEDFAYDLHIAENEIDKQIRFYYTGFPLKQALPGTKKSDVHPRVEINTGEAVSSLAVSVTDEITDCLISIELPMDSTVGELISTWDLLDKETKANFDMVAISDFEAALKTTEPELTLLDHNNIGEHFLEAINLAVFYHGDDMDAPTITTKTAAKSRKTVKIEVSGSNMTFEIPFKKTGGVTNQDIMDAWLAKSRSAQGNFVLLNRAAGEDPIPLTPSAFSGSAALSFDPIGEVTLNDIKHDHSQLFNQIKASMAQQRLVLPPSAAIAGAYTATDANIGVWKSPANIGLSSVIEPVVKMNNKEQEDLNVHQTGKSVNAIRTFSGRGHLVWGARTLDAQSREWKYISVRRLFNMVEESAKKATHFAVFQPNTPLTWLKVRAMLESYLEDLWKAGALVGSTKDQAFFVRVGLGETMDDTDILEGRMNVAIGMAASRPAEFITLNFSHKLQEV